MSGRSGASPRPRASGEPRSRSSRSWRRRTGYGHLLGRSERELRELAERTGREVDVRKARFAPEYHGTGE